MDTFVIEFDHRSDGGPRIVGPFYGRPRAEEHLRSLQHEGWSAVSSIVPLGSVGESLRAAGRGVSSR